MTRQRKAVAFGFRRGNWNTGNDIIYVTTLKSGTASVELNLQLYRSETIRVGNNLVTWAEAMGYWEEANWIRTEFIMMSFIKEPPGKLDVEHIILKG